MNRRRYAAIQLSTRAVCGVGTTEAEARTVASAWTEEDGSALIVVPCTGAAAAAVALHGGAPGSVSVSCTRVCTHAEEAEEDGPSRTSIRALCTEAGEAGDAKMIATCTAALEGDQTALATVIRTLTEAEAVYVAEAEAETAAQGLPKR